MNETDAMIEAKKARMAEIAELVNPLGGSIVDGKLLWLGSVLIDVSAIDVTKLLMVVWQHGKQAGRVEMQCEARSFLGIAS